MTPPTLVIAEGTCFPLFAYDVGRAIDLDAAARHVLLGDAARQTIKQKRRAPAYFEYRPAPLRVTRLGDSLAIGAYRTAPAVEAVIYDFGAVSLSYAIPLDGPLTGVPALAEALWGNEDLLADSRRHVEELLGTLGDAVVRPHIADFVEDYAIFQIAAFTGACEAAALWTEQAHTVAQVLRAAPRSLSDQETSDATALRLSFGPNDATIIDSDASLVFDPEDDDVRAVLEFANTQLLEMRFLDQQLDNTLDRAYDTVGRRTGRFALLGQPGSDLRQLAQLQLDGAILFEQVTNALKLVGEQYLARVYTLVSRRFHLAEWDASITRKLQTIDAVYEKLTERAAGRRMEVLEWIIILLIAFEIVISLAPLVRQ